MTTAATTRTRTITWEDPLPVLERAASMSGLEYMRALGARELPMSPIAVLMGFTRLDAEEGRVVFHAQPGAHHLNPIGVVHGGFAATLLDSAMACAVHTTLPAGVGYTTLELKVNFVRALQASSGEVRATGEVVHRGSRVATAEARLEDADGRLIAHGTTTCLILGS